MVFRCRIRADTNPEKNRAMQYPEAEKRKKDPAWSFVRPISVRMVGINGEMLIRMVKFMKKMAVRKNSGRYAEPELFTCDCVFIQ
jgi:hypothetical protein